MIYTELTKENTIRYLGYNFVHVLQQRFSFLCVQYCRMLFYINIKFQSQYNLHLGTYTTIYTIHVTQEIPTVWVKKGFGNPCPWRWRDYDPSKLQQLSPKLHATDVRTTVLSSSLVFHIQCTYSVNSIASIFP